MDQHQQTSWHPKSSLTWETSHWTSVSLDSVPFHSSSRRQTLIYKWNAKLTFIWKEDFGSSHKCLNWLCLTVFSSLRSSLLLVHLFLPNFFQSTLHLICFDTALCEQPPLSVMAFCDLSSLWRVSMIVFWTIAKSAVFSIIGVSKYKRYPEFILYGWSFNETQM